MNGELSRKVDRAILIIKSVRPTAGDPIEVAYSGGKDSDVILRLTQMAGVPYRAIYKNTTIDPPGTIRHCRENDVEVMRPKATFFQLIRKKGMQGRFRRFCCAELKEYPILRNVVLGIRRSESIKRAKRYKEPIECRVWRGGVRTQQVLPILDWTDQDLLDFINDQRIRLHPLYYNDNGSIDITRRLGCIGCPLASQSKRIDEFKRYPGMLRAYIRNAQVYLDTHKNSVTANTYKNAYEWMAMNLFYQDREKFIEEYHGLFSEETNCKELLEAYFQTKL